MFVVYKSSMHDTITKNNIRKQTLFFLEVLRHFLPVLLACMTNGNNVNSDTNSQKN